MSNGAAKERTVFVIGAGASKEFGLPTGAELKAKIASIVNITFESGSQLRSGDYDFVQTLRTLVASENAGDRNINPYLNAGWRIRDNMPIAPSIDNFLDTHRDDLHVVKLGKLAITACILEAERSSSLYVDKSNIYNRLNFSDISGTWIGQLFSCLVAGRTFSDFLAHISKIDFISFNYDRCIHQFIFLAAKSYFNLDEHDAKQVLDLLNVIYPYGSVGPLRVQSGPFTDFGDSLSGERLISASRGIKTFTEGCDDSVQPLIVSSFERAGKVFFMGFGFLPLNMRMLIGSEVFEVFEVNGVFATGKGLSATSRHVIKEEISRHFKLRIFKDGTYDLGDTQLAIHDKTCGDLVFEYQRILFD